MEFSDMWDWFGYGAAFGFTVCITMWVSGFGIRVILRALTFGEGR